MKDFSVTFLGTVAASVNPFSPTACCLVEAGGIRVMIDAGFGALRQLGRTGLHPRDIDILLITHWHLDHFMGMPALLQFKKRSSPLCIYGPKAPLPALIYLAGLLRAAHVDFEAVTGEGTSFFCQPRESMIPGISSPPLAEDASAGAGLRGIFPDPQVDDLKSFPPDIDRANLHITAIPTVHGVDSFGWVITEKDQQDREMRRLVYSGDTRPVPLILNASRGTDLLIHEATFLDTQANRSHAQEHTTPAQAAKLASEASVGALALTHIPTRNITPSALGEARMIFPGLIVPRLLDKIVVEPVPEELKVAKPGWARIKLIRANSPS